MSLLYYPNILKFNLSFMHLFLLFLFFYFLLRPVNVANLDCGCILYPDLKQVCVKCATIASVTLATIAQTIILIISIWGLHPYPKQQK